MNRSMKQRGFTLLEMAIVLAVIGLITSGILIGKSLLRQVQINSAMTDAQRYITATNNFKQKYGALPGDMPNATSFWGAMSTCPPAAGSASQGGTLTCNGNGDGTLDSWTESLFFWQHLANAQLIQGSYTGIGGAGPGSGEVSIGVNVPAGRLPGLGLDTYYLGNLTGSAGFFDGSYGHVMFLGAFTPDSFTVNPIMTALEAQSFDTKYDDGLPATGSVRTLQSISDIWGYSGHCATTLISSTAAYNTAASGTNSSGLQCSLILITGF